VEIHATPHPGGGTSKVALIRITIMKEVTSVRLRFIGQNGSMGLKFGQIYRLDLRNWKNGIRIVSPVVCPYDSDKAFWKNWAHPDEELRAVLEARGRELRKIHILHEEADTKDSDAPLEEGMLEEQRIGEDV
jgi:hypothetical protein